MKETDLPAPGVGSKSYHLRRIAANAISYLQVVATKYPGGSHPGAAQLAAFFQECADAAAALGLTTPVMTITTAGDAEEVEVGATLATTVGKGGSAGAMTYVSSDTDIATVNASGVVTGVAEGEVTITANMAATSTYRASSVSVDLTVVAAE